MIESDATSPDSKAQAPSSPSEDIIAYTDQSSSETPDQLVRQSKTQISVWTVLREDVDAAGRGIWLPVMMYCFETGFVSAVTFTACSIWAGFESGNTIQMGLAIARLFSPGPQENGTFLMTDRQALTSLISFLIGAALARVTDRYPSILGPKQRSWLILATLVQALFLLIASICLIVAHESSFTLDRGDPSWTTFRGFCGLAFASANLGLQAAVGKKLGQVANTTVVLTTIWVEFVNDPKLLLTPWRKNAAAATEGRDGRFLSIASLFVGALVSRAILAQLGSAATLGIAAGIKLLGSALWLTVPKKQVKH
ncbi:uncharacterized protein L969DRAFT_70206 [Mixia osmundae IAM 14324]|uniref:DUF1275 domain protein n=1 Tax=Mixia osmundae (strain CBS 9802 / IAM 14324 / JCM 22182 / KY 12970) TaxID=764103 RepID=G7DTL0_MIXOS|nr:uncharacterized protein L969DRAFT_70206 [Mixia osmundae IAM 14324]KEI42806.1 hypothetical protein L969DRAFT_70206 [Mixia osmundae IAM 14324]GAA93857.1 hypothetical protein E5Q_00503 [Mixia osmundae IAM 14324]